MMKKFNEFINEDLRSKTIIAPKEFTIDNLKREYPDLNINVTDFNVIISSYNELKLNEEFYKTLKNDDINKDDIVFENCEEIELFDVSEFTKISDYGKFGEGINDFNCASCINLTSLDGTPAVVHGSFNCCNCENLTSLEFAPKTVSGEFNCSYCSNLTSLEGAPKEVGGDFNCEGCKKLTSLSGTPQKVGGYFYCRNCENLTSLDGAPEKISGSFYCKNCNPDFIKLAKAKYGSRVKDKY